ncbi:LPXTG cell wall anchor domain-containing protein [Streptomyces paradoxus]|uniref:LPXTG-motif cell wall-anchored protein n=1 Tax=Streptomyces paradoxus TaxID=66375 RepID=A0A7W9TBZ2_9ACTN|nr:LPXTG cell wall anchor domain-containing protein [Streptomyces paradoxus]MBB6077865.1 LPXTG-motif cell wall-anchored protein [Streptomyces paradoxus]
MATAAASAVLAAVPVIGAQPAHSQPYPPDPPTLTLTATTVVAGDDLGFTGTGFLPTEGVSAFLFSKPVKLGRFTADSNGTVKGTVTIPKWTDPGKHYFRLKGVESNRSLGAKIIVRPHKPHLADTGDDRSLVMVGGSAALLALGAGAVMAVRRRKHN